MEIFVLASSSDGNCLIIRTNNLQLMFDCGISFTRLGQKMKEFNLTEKLDALIITHDHSDHIKALTQKLFNKSFLNETNIYIPQTDLLDDLPINNKKYLSNLQTFTIGDVSITPISMYHDTPTFGFLIENQNERICLIQDTGKVDEKYFELLTNLNLYILETNHDPTLLMSSNREYSLKKRISGPYGHLSNGKAFSFISQVCNQPTKIICCHISKQCNTPLSIQKAFADTNLDPFKVELIITTPEGLDKVVVV
jgi:phosphoribosyl 1,2-cyclic phosphodiesterase